MDCFLTYGLNLDNNQLVSINDVERGLECNCVCHKCGSKLVAKKGEERIHHFAHYDKEDCGGGQMTALHIYVQKILKERKNYKGEQFLYNCPFLINNSCCIYKYRGIVCRTFGLLTKSQNSEKTNVPFVVLKV